MNKDEITERINSFSRWHYLFNLNGCLTPIHDKTCINRHIQRKRYFFDPLVTLSGGSLKGKRVLDVGCNAGFWALKAIESGCDFVLGIDARDMHIQQANFVFETLKIETPRYRFIKSNVFDIDFEQFGSFDIVFFLGLMYHISKPIELMEKITAVNSDLLVIDTFLSSAKGSFLEIGFEKTDDPRLSVDHEIVLRPTKQAIFHIVEQFGYKIFMLEPHFDNYTGAQVYKDGRRRAFLCAKQTNLTHFPKTLNHQEEKN